MSFLMILKMRMFLSSLFIQIGIRKILIMQPTSRLQCSKSRLNFQMKSAMFAWTPPRIRSKILLAGEARFMAGDWPRNWKLWLNCGIWRFHWSIKRFAIHPIRSYTTPCRTLHFVLAREMEKLGRAMVMLEHFFFLNNCKINWFLFRRLWRRLALKNRWFVENRWNSFICCWKICGY